jgi:hypothetical protein
LVERCLHIGFGNFRWLRQLSRNFVSTLLMNAAMLSIILDIRYIKEYEFAFYPGQYYDRRFVFCHFAGQYYQLTLCSSVYNQYYDCWIDILFIVASAWYCSSCALDPLDLRGCALFSRSQYYDGNLSFVIEHGDLSISLIKRCPFFSVNVTHGHFVVAHARSPPESILWLLDRYIIYRHMGLIL